MNHIPGLSYEEFCQLHQQGKISVRANMNIAMHICDSDPRIRKSVKAAHRFWVCVGLLMLIGGPIAIFFIKWYWGLLMFVGSFVVINATRQSAGQFVVEAVLDNESLYHDCLAKKALLITQR